ncbi:MAB_1171c family putative transporter [Kitasatospora sp. NPDC054939]
MFTLLSWTCFLVTLGAFAYKLPALLRSPRNLTLAALCTYFFCNSLAYFVDLEVFRQRISDLVGIPNATMIIVQSSVILLTAAQQVAVANLSLPPAAAKRWIRWQVAGFGVALAVLIALFFTVLPDKQSSGQKAVYLNIQDPDFALYMAYYLAICAVGRMQTVLFAFRYARTVREFWLRFGMWSVAGGSGLILVYCAVRYWQILALHTDGIVEPWRFLFWLIADIGTVFQMIGWTAPSWGPRLGSARRWAADYRSYLRLTPLWRAVYRAAPDVVLEPPHRLPRWLPPRPLDYHLYRRVIEIRDAQLVLRQAADPIAVHRLAQAHGQPHEAVCEAAVLRSALRGPREPHLPQPEAVARTPAAAISLPQEITVLTRLSRAYRKLEARGGRGR